MTHAELDALATSFFAAIEAGDLGRVAEIYAPDAAVWHNVTQYTQTRAENLKLLERFTSSITGLHYEVHAREFFDGGFVQRHTLHGETRAGQPVAVPVCIVIHVSDGRIVRLFEYLDYAAVAPVFEA